MANKPKNPQIQTGSANVFADLGLPDADQRLAKAKLAHEICGLIAAADLTQSQAAKRLGIDQPKVSALMRGRLKDFSTERLLRFINALDQDVFIVIKPAKHVHHGMIQVLSRA